MATYYNPKIVTSGLVLALDAANTKSYPGSGTTWTDLSATGGTAQLNNGPTFSNNIFTFDGTNDFARISRTDLNGGSFSYGEITVNIWIKTPINLATGSNGKNIITVETAFEISIGGNGNGYGNLTYASNPWGWFGNTGDVYLLGTWIMITFKHAATGRWLYVNGQQVFYKGDTGNILSGTSQYPYLTLMARYDGTSSNASGDLSIVQLYNRTLSAAEISQNFNATRSRYGV